MRKRKRKRSTHWCCLYHTLQDWSWIKAYRIKKINSQKYDLLISFGGFDEKNIIGIITEILPFYLDKLKVEIILGPVNRKKRKLYNLQKKYPKNLFIKESTNDMAKEMDKTKY